MFQIVFDVVDDVSLNNFMFVFGISTIGQALYVITLALPLALNKLPLNVSAFAYINPH